MKKITIKKPKGNYVSVHEFNKVCREMDALKTRLENAGATNYCKDCAKLCEMVVEKARQIDLLMTAANDVLNHREACISFNDSTHIPLHYFHALSSAVKAALSGNNPKKVKAK